MLIMFGLIISFNIISILSLSIYDIRNIERGLF